MQIRKYFSHIITITKDTYLQKYLNGVKKRKKKQEDRKHLLLSKIVFPFTKFLKPYQ